MPRFFFDFRQGDEFTPDSAGSEFPSAEKAYLGAYRAAGEMWAELLAGRRDPRRCSFEIHDSNRNLLSVLPFRELLDSCHDSVSVAANPSCNVSAQAEPPRSRAEGFDRRNEAEPRNAPTVGGPIGQGLNFR